MKFKVVRTMVKNVYHVVADDNDIETGYFGEEPYDLTSLHRTISLEVPHGKEYPLSAVIN